jgi:hypothetical protein
MAKVQVVASDTGFDGVSLRNKGDTFEVSDVLARQHSSWFKPVDPKFKVEPKREPVPVGEVSSELAVMKAQIAQLTALLAERTEPTKNKGKAKPAEPDGTELV